VRITKLDAAIHQLNVAIRLFLSGDYLASLTLAGAAEEILGRLSERASKPVAVEFVVNYHLKDTDSALPDKDRKRIIRDVLNSGRNQAKHANDPNETHFDVEQIYPLQMIMRAVPMCKDLGVKQSAEVRQINDWIQAHPEALE
jgi:hypothetical protein